VTRSRDDAAGFTGAGGALTWRPLTAANWSDFVALFGPNGACGGCWCMWWRMTRREFEARHGEKNRRAMKRIVDSGEVPGIIGYEGCEPVGWCSVAPRDRFPSLDRSRVLRRIDDEPVWSIVCLFVARPHRGTGVARFMVRSAVEYAEAAGARVVEAYPVNPRGRARSSTSGYMGVPSIYAPVGFVECARPSEARIIMRYVRE
jgi:GNAT superfamily N-acetyltransferase